MHDKKRLNFKISNDGILLQWCKGEPAERKTHLSVDEHYAASISLIGMLNIHNSITNSAT